MINTTILMPAYGRSYATVEAALVDWKAGNDFRIFGNGSYCSIRDLASMADSFTTVYIRLMNLNKSVVVSS